MASSSAVRPLGAVSISRLCKSSTLFVNVLVSSARSLKLTRKNSSCGFAVLKNCTAASRAFATLFAMLPLKSKITPIEMGTSSAENVTSSCSTLSSNTRKLSGSRPVTSRLYGSVTVTLTRARSTSVFMPTLGLIGTAAVFFRTSSFLICSWPGPGGLVSCFWGLSLGLVSPFDWASDTAAPNRLAANRTVTARAWIGTRNSKPDKSRFTAPPSIPARPGRPRGLHYARFYHPLGGRQTAKTVRPVYARVWLHSELHVSPLRLAWHSGRAWAGGDAGRHDSISYAASPYQQNKQGYFSTSGRL